MQRSGVTQVEGEATMTNAASGGDRPHVVITGLMGVGKSTAGRALAAELGVAHRDSDDDIRRLFGLSGVELAERHGVDELHRIESALLLGALASEQPTVVSAAAWVVEDPRCRAAMARRATVVVLEATITHLVERIATGAHRRPMDRQELELVAARRAPLFDEVADISIDADRPAEVVAADLSRQIAATRASSTNS